MARLSILLSRSHGWPDNAAASILPPGCEASGRAARCEALPAPRDGVEEEPFSRLRSALRLAHPHILPLHDSGEAGGLLNYVMLIVRGESLLDPSRDYLDDAVPTRWAELLQANGMTTPVPGANHPYYF